MGSRKAKLLTESDSNRIRTLAMKDPQLALKDLRATLAVKIGVHTAKKFSIDAIGRTAKRRSPMRLTGSLDQEFAGDPQRQELVATVRDIMLNFSFGKGLVRQHIKNVIGVGPRIQATTDDDEYNRRAEKYFNGRKNLIDVRGMPFSTSLRVGENSEIIDGDYGIMILKGGATQYIEGDRIRNPPNKRNSKNRSYVNGVELNGAGKTLAFHIWNRGNRPGMMKYAKRVEAKNFIHCLRQERFDQVRGICWIVSAVNDLQDLRETLEAAKGKWKIENMLGVAIESDMPEADDLASLWGDLTTYKAQNADGSTDDRSEVKLGQGIHSFELKPGEKIKTIESTTPNNTFEPMTILLIRIIALTLDMPLEIALQYYTRGSYSATRAAFVQYFDAMKTRRTEIEENKLDRYYRWVIGRAIKSGSLEGPKDEIEDPTTHKWQWPGMTITDPEKQRRADKEGYKLCVESLGGITSRDGNFWQDVATAKIKEVVWITEQCKKAGIDPALILPAVTDPGEQPISQTDEEKDTDKESETE